MHLRPKIPALFSSETPRKPSAPAEEPLARRWRSELLWMGPLGLLLVALLLWSLTAERRALMNMEPQARAVLFQEVYASFQHLCQERMEPGLGSHCRQQAGFLSLFPECGPECQQELSFFMHSTR